MKELIEKIISYILGGLIAVALLIIVFNLKIFSEDINNYVTSIYILVAIIGVLISALVFEYKEYKVVKKNNKIRNETITLITHEMRTGLTSTSWIIQSILENYNNKITLNDLNILKGVINSIHGIVAHSVNLLDISVLDIQKLLIDLKWVSLKKVEEMFLESIEKYKIICQKNEVILINDINLNHQREMEVDLMRLRVIFENLMDNALQYMQNDKKVITILINNDDINMSVKVSDTGIGIPQKEQSKVFSQFFRASNARNKLIAGSGIGLYMCQQYIQAHRGHIIFESKENEGSIFSFTIPLKTFENVNEFLEKI